MLTRVIDETTQFGFVTKGVSPHNSRTIMVADLRVLLAGVPNATSIEKYRQAIVEENILLKPTISARIKVFRHLRELYTLKPSTLIFRGLLDLWNDDHQAQPLLALLCATARDPILRLSNSIILTTTEGTIVPRERFSALVAETFPSRFSDKSIKSMGQNLASSWQQSGHLKGKLTKVRVRAESHSTSVAYALWLGWLEGVRGENLFETAWAQLLDTPKHILHEKAQLASQKGWMEYRHAGNVTEITFRHLMRKVEENVE